MESEVSQVKTGTPSTDCGHTSDRLSSALRHLVHLTGLGQEHELVDAVVQAAAIWYDLDARAYKRDLHGRFVLDTWLPGADLTFAPRDFSSFAIVLGSEVIRISSIAEQEQLGWKGLPGDLVMLPIPAGTQSRPRWVVVISDWRDSQVDPCLVMLCQILGAFLEQLAVRQIKEAQQRLLPWLVQSDESLEQVATAVLKELVDVVGAAQARLVVRATAEAQPRTLASVGGDWADTPLPALETGQSIISAKRIAVVLAVGPEAVAVVDMCPPADTEFTDTHGMLGEAGAMVLGVWLAGTLKGTADGGQASMPAPTASFEAAMAEEVRLAARLSVPAGLLVIDVVQSTGEGTPRIGSLPVPEDVSKQIRSSDLAGRLEGGDLGVLLISADAQGLALAATRIRQRLDEAARRAGFPSVTLGLAAFSPGAQSVATVVARARANAVRAQQ